MKTHTCHAREVPALSCRISFQKLLFSLSFPHFSPRTLTLRAATRGRCFAAETPPTSLRAQVCRLPFRRRCHRNTAMTRTAPTTTPTAMRGALVLAGGGASSCSVGRSNSRSAGGGEQPHLCHSGNNQIFLRRVLPPPDCKCTWARFATDLARAQRKAALAFPSPPR